MSSRRPLQILRLQRVVLALTVVALGRCTALKAGAAGDDQTPPAARGRIVSDLGKSIWVVFQARNNDYWFGSDGQGVYRYDGKTIVQFTAKDGLPGDRVREIKEDKAGNIFIGTLDGISKFDGKRFENLTPVEVNRPNEGWRLDPGDLWFKGDSMVHGPYRYDGKTLYHLKFPKHDLEEEYAKNYPKPVASPYGVYTIYEDSNGSLWFGTAEFGACRYDGKSFGWLYERDLTMTPEGGSFGIRSIMEDKDGKFWICNTGQRYSISKDVANRQGKIAYSTEKGVRLPKTLVGKDVVYYNTITRDNNQNLWMSTYGEGVWRFDGKTLSHYPVKDGDKDVLGVSISRDNHNNLWLGTQDSGVYRLNGMTFERFRP